MPESAVAPATEQASSAKFKELNGREPAEVARFWLSNSEARGILNEQLAEILRVILEQRARIESLSFSFCPICGDQLSPYEQPDIWMKGLRCSSGHTWAERGGKLGGEHLRLHSEPTVQVMRSLVSGWLRDTPVLRSNMHASIRRVLEGSSYAGGAA